MAGKRRKHSEEFKRDAVSLTFKSGKGITEIAEDLGLNRSVLARWCREHEELGNNAFPGNGLRKLSPLEEENLRLKKELADTREERDILKKAVHIFSRRPK